MCLLVHEHRKCRCSAAGVRPSDTGFTGCPASGFSLLEIIIVVSLIAMAYAIAAPNLGVNTEAEIANKLGRLNSDVRTAYDLTVLSGKPHRIVFSLISGDYWLESTERRDFTVRLANDEKAYSEDEEVYRQEEFEDRFKEYEELAGEAFKDPKTDENIPPVSPVLKAKDKLAPARWHKVSNLEWKDRSLGEELIIRDFRAEHHRAAISLENADEETVAHLYFFPSGYVERAVAHIYNRAGADEPDLEQKPYTFMTHPHRGESSVLVGHEELDVHEYEEP